MAVAARFPAPEKFADIAASADRSFTLNTIQLPTDYFDYDGALADLREMYERGRQWIAQHITDAAIKSAEFMAIYTHTLELSFAMMAFRELTILPEAV